jgi:catechol 2,3-dioxygenase-like lactoylglutathione lyase family enzyme
MPSHRVELSLEEVPMATATESALQAKAIMPGFTVNDLQKSTRFYEGLGFVIEDRWEVDGALVGYMMRAGAVRLGLDQDDWKKGRDRVKGIGMRLMFATDQDIDQLAAHAKAAGITLDEEPHDADWGGRAFSVTDPDGFKLTFFRENRAG